VIIVMSSIELSGELSRGYCVYGEQQMMLVLSQPELQSILVSGRRRVIAMIDSAQSIYALFGGIDDQDP
jgi:hypothetical protein